MKFINIADDIIHVLMPDNNTLAACMCRIQEYYESPFPEIKGKIFTLGMLRAVGSRENPGVYTYEGGNFFEADWSGYNWPSYCLEPFIRGLFDPLTPYEQDLVNALRCKTGPFYVIGTFGEDDPSASLDHEVCHALYYTRPLYKADVDEVLGKYREQLRAMHEGLIFMGYGVNVLDDEAHAYLSADYDYFFKEHKDVVDKFKIVIDKGIHYELREVKAKHFKENEGGCQ